MYRQCVAVSLFSFGRIFKKLQYLYIIYFKNSVTALGTTSAGPLTHWKEYCQTNKCIAKITERKTENNITLL